MSAIRVLPELLRGEDPDFCTLILRIATEEADPPANG